MKQISRRKFLSLAGGLGVAAALRGPQVALAAPVPRRTANRKLIVVLFGGGTRSSESIDDPQHRYIPHLWNDMVPRGTLFTNMRVEHKVVHPNSAGSIVTGHWEWDDIDWSKPVANPTIFEIYRKSYRLDDTATWAFVYASILAKTGHSLAHGYGSRYAANVIEPPTIPRSTAIKMEALMRNAAAVGSDQAQIDASKKCQMLARSTSSINTTNIHSQTARNFLNDRYHTWKSSSGTTSHDAFLADQAIACMKTFAPDVIFVAFGEIDCAHYGSWSRYTQAITRTDELTFRIWKTAEQLSEYRGRTLMLILPDHGRELDRPGHWGFIHHSDFYTNQGADEGCRRVWMLTLGPGTKAEERIDKPIPITTVAATGLEYLNLEPSAGSDKSIWKLTG